MADLAVLQAHADANHGEEANSKKPYVRVMTDKRREQNRRAQKSYREKLKRKLEDLEEQVASTSARQDEQSQKAPAPNPSFGRGLDEPDTPPVADVSPNVIDFDSILSAGGDLSIPSISFASNFDFPLPSPSQSPTPSPAFSPKALTYRDEIPEGTDPLSLWHMPHRPAGVAYSPPPNASSTYMAGSLTAISPNYAYEHQKALIRRKSPQPKATPFNKPSSPGVPSPQLNLLRLTSESNLSASLAIGLSLGISSTAYLEDHPSRFPGCTTHLFPNATLAQLAGRKFPHAPQEFKDHVAMIKKPLRPCAAQMFYSHPSYLDCIVFPRFRERVVQASVEGKLDHVEFFLDLMHGGLVCWGSTLPGVTKRKRRRGMYDQVAWSTRSWEARRWFLEKWEWLCGTKEEEEMDGDADGIWHSSRWWWAVRGEFESDEEWSEDEEEEEDFLQEARRMRRFVAGVRDENDARCEERKTKDQRMLREETMWAEGRKEAKGQGEGASNFDIAGIVYSTPSSGFDGV